MPPCTVEPVVARTLIARLPRLFRTRYWVPKKTNTIAADIIVFGIISSIFFFILMKYVVCTH